MELLSALSLAMAAVALVMGYWHGRVFARGGREREQLPFVVLCLSIGLYGVGGAISYASAGSAEAAIGQRLQNLGSGVAAAALVWFTTLYTRIGSRRLAWLFTAYYGVHVLALATLWNDWVFTAERRVTTVRLPWGPILRYQELRHGPLLRFSDAVYALVILCVLAWVGRYWLRAPAGERTRARRLALGLGVFLLGALNDLAVTSELYEFAYVMEHAYIGMILVMSHSLSSSVLEMARTRGELRRSLARLERIIDSVDELYLETTLDGTILEVSPSVRRWVGDLDLRGRSSWEFYAHADDRRRLVELLRRQGRVRDFESTALLPDGRTVACSSNLALVRDEASGEQRIVGSLRDISEQKRVLSERRRLEERMQHAQKLEGLGLLAGGIAHDFNNLLTGILGYVELALVKLEPEHRARARVEAIRPIAQRATELCRQMLAYSGRARFDVAPLDLSALVREMGELLRISTAKPVALEYELADELPAVVADATQLRQILLNLVVNAGEAIAGAGCVSVRTRLVPCTEAQLMSDYVSDPLPAGVYVALEVADTGCGMDEATRRRMFDPFFTTKFSGRGLGLAAVLGIVRAHRGTIHVESAIGKGSSFRVLLPSAPSVEPEARPREAATAWKGRGRILLVDDEPWVREVAAGMLDHLGFEATLAEGGRQALEIFHQDADRFALAIVDLTMPGLSGIEVVRELLQIRPGLPVLLSSGYSEEEGDELLAREGAMGFLPKPFSLDALRLAIRDALSAAR